MQLSIKSYQEQQKQLKFQEDKDDLDDFMSDLQAKEIQIDKTEIRKLRVSFTSQYLTSLY